MLWGMPFMYNKKRAAFGFTLVEVIVVLVILAVLAAVLVPSLIGYIDLANEKVCLVNRSAILRHYKTIYSYNYPNVEAVTLQNILEGEYSDFVEDISAYSCPSGGIYSVSEDGLHINCSIHGAIGDIPEGGGSTNPTDSSDPSDSNTYPGTNILLSSDSVWPDPPYTQDEYTLTEGSVFQYSDNNYYVITKTWDIWKGNAAIGPYEITSRKWDGVVRVSGKTLTTADVSGDKFYLADIGDIYDDGNGNYYIYTSYNGRDAKVPTGPNSYNWFKLPTS
jgi:prepilin-type N-terminal cleavage/methylation domain-containing protein